MWYCVVLQPGAKLEQQETGNRAVSLQKEDGAELLSLLNLERFRCLEDEQNSHLAEDHYMNKFSRW
jgi:hypothetical protein